MSVHPFAWALAACLAIGSAPLLEGQRSTPEPTPPLQSFVAAKVGPVSGFTREDWQNLDALYAARGFSPLWSDSRARPNDDAGEALALLCEAFEHGLDPADYWAELLERQAARLDTGWATAGEATRFEGTLSVALLRYFHDLRLGRVSPRVVGVRLDAPSDRPNFVAVLVAAVASHRLRQAAEALAPQTPQYRSLQVQLEHYRGLASGPAPSSLRAQLAALGDLSSDGSETDAIRRFQSRHGLEPDGVLGPRTTAALAVPLQWRVRQLELALERLRWLPDTGADERVVVLNIPMFRLWGRDAAKLTPAFAMDAIVGRALSTETPVLVEQMREVIFRPYWNVPPSILKSEILPNVQRDPKYLADQRFEIVRADGADGPIAWSDAALAGLRSGALRVRQRPGTGNALGLVKFVFPNDQSVYLHGASDQTLFAKDRRDFSHGCVRVADPAALAQWVLSDDPAWDRDRVHAAMNGSDELRVPLMRPITVILFYTTALVGPEDGALHFAQDIYGHDARLDRTLRATR